MIKCNFDPENVVEKNIWWNLQRVISKFLQKVYIFSDMEESAFNSLQYYDICKHPFDVYHFCWPFSKWLTEINNICLTPTSQLSLYIHFDHAWLLTCLMHELDSYIIGKFHELFKYRFNSLLALYHYYLSLLFP